MTCKLHPNHSHPCLKSSRRQELESLLEDESTSEVRKQVLHPEEETTNEPNSPRGSCSIPTIFLSPTPSTVRKHRKHGRLDISRLDFSSTTKRMLHLVPLKSKHP